MSRGWGKVIESEWKRWRHHVVRVASLKTNVKLGQRWNIVKLTIDRSTKFNSDVPSVDKVSDGKYE